MSFREEMDLPRSVTLSPVEGLFIRTRALSTPALCQGSHLQMWNTKAIPLAQLCGSKLSSHPHRLASGALQAVTVLTSYVPVSMELSL